MKTCKTCGWHTVPDNSIGDECHGCLEFSDYGRSERFPSGWYMLPAVVISLLIWWVILSWLFSH